MRDDDLPAKQDADSDGVTAGVLGDSRSPDQIPDSAPERSLTDDINALIDDGKTYAEAEYAYQKTRLSYAAGHGKSGLGFILAALGFLHLALIALVVGAVIALIPYLGAIGATLTVAGILLVGVVIFGLLVKKHFERIGAAFEADQE